MHIEFEVCVYRIRELDMKEMKKTIESLIIIGLIMKLKNRQIKQRVKLMQYLFVSYYINGIILFNN